MSNRTYSAVPSDFKGAAGFPYIFDPSYVLVTGVPKPITGAWRPWNSSTDIGTSNISVSGLSLTVGAVAITGTPPVSIANGSITVVNPVLPVSGIVTANTVDTGNRSVQVANTAPMPFSGVATILSLPTQNVAITGSQTVTVTGTQVSLLGTPTVALAANALVGITGGTINVTITGGVVSASSSAVAITGNPIVSLSGATSVFVDYTRPVYVTGSFSSAPANTVITGFNSTIAPLAVSGAFSANVVDTGNRSVLLAAISPTLPPVPVSGAFTASVSDTGNRSVNLVTFSPTLAPLPVSGSFTATPGNTAITGFNSTIPPLAITGIVTALTVDTGVRAVNVVANVPQLVINSGGYVGVTGTVAVNIIQSITQPTINSGGWVGITGDQRGVVISGGFIAVTGGQMIGIDTGNRSVSIVSLSPTLPPIPVSGVFSATTDNTTVVLAVASGNVLLQQANVIGSGISGQLAANLAGSAPISGDIRNIPGTALNVTGYVIAVQTGAASANVSISNPIGVTGVNRDTNANFNNGTLYTFLPIGGRATAATGAGAATGYASGAYAMLNINQANGGLFVSQADLNNTSDSVSVTTSGIFNVAVTGFNSTIAPLAVSGSFTATPGNTAITGFNSTIAPLAVSGVFNASVTIAAVAITGNVTNVVLSGGYTAVTGTVAVNNLGGFVGITGDQRNVVISGGFLAITGTPNVNIVSSITQATYISGGYLAITGDQRNVVISGGYLGLTGSSVVQVTGWNTGIAIIAAPVSSAAISVTSPSGVAPFSSMATSLVGQAMAANANRIMMFIQNTHTGIPLYVKLGATAASTGNFSMILNPSANLGWGGDSFSDDHYRGAVQVSGGAWNAWEV